MQCSYTGSWGVFSNPGGPGRRPSLGMTMGESKSNFVTLSEGVPRSGATESKGVSEGYIVRVTFSVTRESNQRESCEIAPPSPKVGSGGQAILRGTCHS